MPGGPNSIVISHDTEPVIVLQTLTGSTLSALIQSEHPEGMPPGDVRVLGRQLCSVLHYLHGHGQLHLDLKPSNIVCTGGIAVVLDLGLAQPPGTCSAGSGTPEYMAPEQATGGRVDAATDLWGLGGVLYRAVTGHRPFARHDDTERGRPDLDVLHSRCTDPGLTALITACMDPDPVGRPSLAAARDRLEAC